MYWVVKLISKMVMMMPSKMALGLGRMIGWLGYYWGPHKRRQVAYRNLRIAFGGVVPDQQIIQILRSNYQSFGQNIIELLRLPVYVKDGIRKKVRVEGEENLKEALARNKGVILLAMHSGNWELSSLVGSMTGHPYNMVANPQGRMGPVEKLLNEYRQLADCKIVNPGFGMRDVIRCLQANEIVSLVADQGGVEGALVNFFGRPASMSTGAVRLARKYGASICLVDISRNPDGSHCLTVDPPLELLQTNASEDEDIRVDLQKIMDRFEELIRRHPHEYMWFYKVWKYSPVSDVLILDDGRTGHLRQSQALARILEQELKEKGKQVLLHTAEISYRNEFFRKLSKVMAFAAQYIRGLRCRGILRLLLSRKSFEKLVSLNADYIISCGEASAGMNLLSSGFYGGRRFVILKPGALSFRHFDLIVLPQHDVKKNTTNCVVTRAALNLIDKEYLSEKTKLLLNRFSHLKNNYRTKIGILIGGNTKNVEFTESVVKILIHQVKEVALQLNADIILTTSRRTPENIEQLIWKEFKKFERCALLISASKTDVPEAVGGILGISDCIVVSGESISMVSEAISSGKKTVVFNLTTSESEKDFNKYERFMEKLSEQGYIALCSVKGVSQAVYCVMSDKMQLKQLSDRDVVRQAVRKVL